jgi:uncharacterized membrane protein (DUF485 family)
VHIITSTLGSLWKVTLIGLVLGAGLPLIFAFGVRFMSTQTADGRRNNVGFTAAIACFAVVAVAVVAGILYVAKDFIAHQFGIHLF